MSQIGLTQHHFSCHPVCVLCVSMCEDQVCICSVAVCNTRKCVNIVQKCIVLASGCISFRHPSEHWLTKWCWAGDNTIAKAGLLLLILEASKQTSSKKSKPEEHNGRLHLLP